MTIITFPLITKTFFFLRVFKTLTPIVVMLQRVIYDLKIFMLFFAILILLLSRTFAVLGLGNAAMRTDLTSRQKGRLVTKLRSYKDYQFIGLSWGDFMWTLRISIGDNSAIGDAAYL